MDGLFYTADVVYGVFMRSVFGCCHIKGVRILLTEKS